MESSPQLYLIPVWSNEFWASLYAILVMHTIAFIFAAIFKDNGIIDIQWGLSFIIANYTALGIRFTQGKSVKLNLDNRTLISNILVTIWGLRMAIHVFLRT